MKLKYKKVILLTTMSTMGIGILTLSLSHNKTNAEENIPTNAKIASIMSTTAVEEDDMTDAKTAALVEDALLSTAPTFSPTPTPLPVYAIEDEGHPRIEKLIKNYYIAKNNRDVEELKSLLSDPANADTQEELQKKTQYIDDYRNIKVYVKKGFEKGTFIVFAYHEIKFTGINTPAPGLAQFYIVTDENKDIKIFSGEMDEEIQTYYDLRVSDDDVIELIKLTDKKSDEAIEKDEDLLNFWKNIDEANAKTVASKETQAEGDSN